MFFIAGLVSSCEHSGHNKVKLTKSEKYQLVAFARKVIVQLPPNRLTESEKNYIENTQPVFGVKYTGYKKGRFSLRWDIDDLRCVRYEGEGAILDFRRSFKRLVLNGPPKKRTIK